MTTVPAINCPDADCVQVKLRSLAGFLPAGNWIQIDVEDAIFTHARTWADPKQLMAFMVPLPKWKWEVHLMVEHPERDAEQWLASGAKRLIVHVERLTPDVAQALVHAAGQSGASVMLASNPETKTEVLEPYLSLFSEFQVLSVTPGWSGQQFLPYTVDKIKWLHEKKPQALIEVDGGMNAGAAAMVKAAGANQIVAASYLFEAADKVVAFHELQSI